jgi:hypothetical protein
MRIRRLLIAVCLTACSVVLARWFLSVYLPVSPIRNAPGIAARFDGEQAMRRLDSLTHKFKGRIIGSVQGFASADYVAEQFRLYGLKVEIQDFREAGGFSRNESGWYSGRNVIGILPGWGKGIVILTAHRDCAPQALEGAYDNGSGTAVILELARVLSVGGPHRYTYAFAALDGEEIGLAGARFLMNHRPKALKDIRLMINLDMVGIREADLRAVFYSQYLSAEVRALAETHFSVPQYGLFQIPMSRGSDALLYAWRGLSVIDIYENSSKKSGQSHNAADTYDQISTGSIQKVGRDVEQLILQGDALDAFAPTSGFAPSNVLGVLPFGRYLTGGVCILVALGIPLLFRIRFIIRWNRPGWAMVVLVFVAGILTSLSTLWSGSVWFVFLPILGLIILTVLQVVILRRAKRPDSGIGRFIVAAVPSVLFAGTWLLTGLWPLGLWIAAPAYLPAVFLTWRTGWGWRLLDVILLLPAFLLALGIALVAWISAPLHLFPAAKLSVFTAFYVAALLACIWGIFGRRQPRRVLTLPDQEDVSVS